MFENVGRQPDRWYWFRMLVAAWLLLCAVVVGGYALLGYLFLRFLVWLFFALLALIFPVVNPISFDEFLPVRVTEVQDCEITLEDPYADEIVDWDIDEPAWVIDDSLPPLAPEPPPERVDVRREAVVEAVASTALLAKIIGTTGSDAVLMDVLSSSGEEMGVLGALVGTGGMVEGFGVGGLGTGIAVGNGTGTLRGSSGGGNAAGLGTLGVIGSGADDVSLGGASGVIGGVPGGVVGGVLGGDEARSVPVGALTFKKQTMPAELAGVRCRVRITFGEDGRVQHGSPMGCPGELRHEVRRAVSRWRIEPWKQDGEPVPVRTTIDLPIDP